MGMEQKIIKQWCRVRSNSLEQEADDNEQGGWIMDKILRQLSISSPRMLMDGFRDSSPSFSSVFHPFTSQSSQSSVCLHQHHILPQLSPPSPESHRNLRLRRKPCRVCQRKERLSFLWSSPEAVRLSNKTKMDEVFGPYTNVFLMV